MAENKDVKNEILVEEEIEETDRNEDVSNANEQSPSVGEATGACQDTSGRIDPELMRASADIFRNNGGDSQPSFGELNQDSS